jgi:hypothetical protein
MQWFCVLSAKNNNKSLKSLLQNFLKYVYVTYWLNCGFDMKMTSFCLLAKRKSLKIKNCVSLDGIRTVLLCTLTYW